jgi:putative endonuclease
MTIQQTIGKKGEDLAVRYLEEQNYKILERNWRSGRAEIDIIATEGEILVFVEVKTRSSTLFGAPELSVDDRKELLIFSAANRYMEEKEYGWAIRFDMISILFSEFEEAELKHYKDFFH